MASIFVDVLVSRVYHHENKRHHKYNPNYSDPNNDRQWPDQVSKVGQENGDSGGQNFQRKIRRDCVVHDLEMGGVENVSANAKFCGAIQNLDR